MKRAIFNLALALVICVVSIVGYGIWYVNVSSTSATVASLQEKIDTKDQAVSRLASVRTALSEVAGDEASVQNYFVSSGDVVSFIDDLQARGKTQNASVNVVSVSAAKGGAHAMLALALTVKGTFAAVMNTVGSIEFAPYDLIVTGLSLTKGNKGAWRADMNIAVGSSDALPATGTPALAPSASVSAPSSGGGIVPPKHP